MKHVMACVLLVACALPAQAEEPVISAADDGIEIESLRLTAAGNMVDLRLKVTDAEKAARVLDGANQPMLKVKGAGKTLVVPAPAKIGPLKATAGKLETGRTYFVLFGNPKRMLQSGQQVDLRFGPYLIPDLMVEN